MQWKRDSQPKPGADGHDGDAYTCHDADSSTKSVADNAHAMHMVLILKPDADVHDGDAFHGALV